MNRKEEFKELKKEYKNISIPENAKEQLQEVVQKAREDKRKNNRRKVITNWFVATAAVLVLMILPNTNEAIANSMQELPIIGNIFKVITVREYKYKEKNAEINAKVPKIEYRGEHEQNKQAVENINKEAEEYTEQLVKQFKKDMKNIGYGALDISYRKVTDNEAWFTLVFDATEVRASGYQFHKYYHLDKTSGKLVHLKDIFKENTDYVSVISKEIRKQMKSQMKNSDVMYFIKDNCIKDGFENISKNQNFYFDSEGRMVIVFDEYEVGPGSIGTPEFTIPKEITEPILK